MSLALRPRSRRDAARIDDTFLERVAKLVPIDVLSLFLVPVTLLPPTAWHGWTLVAVAAGVVLVPVLLYWDAARSAARLTATQYVIRTLVFVAWALVLSSPFAAWLHFDARIAMACALLLPVIGERAISRGAP